MDCHPFNNKTQNSYYSTFFSTVSPISLQLPLHQHPINLFCAFYPNHTYLFVLPQTLPGCFCLMDYNIEHVTPRNSDSVI